MKTKMKKTLALLLALLCAVSCFAVLSAAESAFTPVADKDFLHTEGERIVNANGETVVLRGTNFGGWGIMEDWFCPYTSPAGEDVMFQTLV